MKGQLSGLETAHEAGKPAVARLINTRISRLDFQRSLPASVKVTAGEGLRVTMFFLAYETGSPHKLSRQAPGLPAKLPCSDTSS